jgi:Rrf2 family protein
MFAISKNVEYALMCLRVLSEERETWSSRDLSDRFHIPLKLLEKILQKLAFHNLINSTKGPSGGYTLK